MSVKIMPVSRNHGTLLLVLRDLDSIRFYSTEMVVVCGLRAWQIEETFSFQRHLLVLCFFP